MTCQKMWAEDDLRDECDDPNAAYVSFDKFPAGPDEDFLLLREPLDGRGATKEQPRLAAHGRMFSGWKGGRVVGRRVRRWVVTRLRLLSHDGIPHLATKKLCFLNLLVLLRLSNACSIW